MLTFEYPYAILSFVLSCLLMFPRVKKFLAIVLALGLKIAENTAQLSTSALLQQRVLQTIIRTRKSV